MHQTPESRCLICGCPAIDHQPLRYVLKAWFWHHFHTRVERFVSPLLNRLEDTTP